MRLYIARHAQTNFNVAKLCNTDPLVDVHLTNIGKQQALKLAEALKFTGIEVIYISELRRTKQTADFINLNHNVPMLVEPRINDNRTGFDGQSVDIWIEQFEQSIDPWNAQFGDGESIVQAANRVNSFMKYLRQEPYNSVLIVTHGFITQAIHSNITGCSLEDSFMNYSIPQGKYAEFSI